METEHDQNEAAQPVSPGAGSESHAGAGRHDSEAGGVEQTMQAAAERIAALEAELAEMRERWMRSEAEAQNIRNRARRDVEEARQFAVQKFARDVVEAAENLRRGLAAMPAPSPDEDPLVTRMREGFEGVERSFVGILERNGIVGVDPTGEPFDANLHQAMAEQPSDTAAPGTVLAAWTKAWTLNGRLLKPAMVVVAKSEGAKSEGAKSEGAKSEGPDQTAGFGPGGVDTTA